jgi:anaerobic selenocysteine-containing dehydrogenase
MCWNTCGIKVNRVDGVIVKIEGDPDCPQNWGKTCAKGNSGFMSLYDPKRVLYPMRRTNPDKGYGVDPKWERISWDEALKIITQRLKKIRMEDRVFSFRPGRRRLAPLISGAAARSTSAATAFIP